MDSLKEMNTEMLKRMNTKNLNNPKFATVDTVDNVVVQTHHTYLSMVKYSQKVPTWGHGVYYPAVTTKKKNQPIDDTNTVVWNWSKLNPISEEIFK